MGTRIKKDDEVVVISGRDKGRTGRVLKVIREKDQVIVEGVGRVKKHQKPNQQNQQGGIIEKDLPIHASKVMLLDASTGKPSRVRAGKDADGKKVRVTVKSGTTLTS
ncbi:MAG: 50S ribosomal protein L24 [Polyangiales bacterium]